MAVLFVSLSQGATCALFFTVNIFRNVSIENEITYNTASTGCAHFLHIQLRFWSFYSVSRYSLTPDSLYTLNLNTLICILIIMVGCIHVIYLVYTYNIFDASITSVYIVQVLGCRVYDKPCFAWFVNEYKLKIHNLWFSVRAKIFVLQDQDGFRISKGNIRSQSLNYSRLSRRVLIKRYYINHNKDPPPLWEHFRS